MTALYTIALILIFFLIVIVQVIELGILKGFLFGAPWVPLSKKRLNFLIDSLQLNPDDVLYDLGSGDARVLIVAAKKYNLKKAVGIEISYFFYFWSKFLIKLKGFKKQIFIIRGNFLEKDLTEADVVVCYLFPKILAKLKDKFKRELKPGSKIFSVDFAISGWQPKTVITNKQTKIYIYQF